MECSQRILRWFDKHGRKDLPWQTEPTAYRVWVSEIMLQQTQVSTVSRYFDAFIHRFPDIDALAQASLDEVLHAWAGLGYYARAKNLHRAAQLCVANHHSQFPKDFDDVLNLPGIGRSTAGAILAISTRQRYPILDGNVKRVLSRYFAVSGWLNDPKTIDTLWALSEKITPHKRVDAFTQAIMDLGATLCTRTHPKCAECPIHEDCQAKAQQRVTEYPKTKPAQKKPTQSTTCLILFDPNQQAILFEKRPLKGIWGGLWSLPECPVATEIKHWCREVFDLSIQQNDHWEPFRHTFTHYHLNIHPVLCHVKSLPKKKRITEQYHWCPLTEIHTLGLPAPIKRLLVKMERKQS